MFLTGQFTTANLTRTDITGELKWVMDAQGYGLHADGVDTILTGNGCIYSRFLPLPNGSGTLTIAAGDLAADSTTPNFITAGRPTLTTLLPTWLFNAFRGTFYAKVKDPDLARPVRGGGVYLPKTNSARGFFPGQTVGGRIELIGPN